VHRRDCFRLCDHGLEGHNRRSDSAQFRADV
jgi:hypothetical protein